MTRRARLALISMLLLVVVCSASLFWILSARLTEEATNSQINEILMQTQRSATDAIYGSTQSVESATGIVARAVASEDPAFVEQMMFNSLQLAPDLSGTYVAGHDGSFFFVFRTEDGFGTKLIEPATETADRRVVLTNRDSMFNVVNEWTDETDSYDPRDRPWYISATAAPGKPIWTDAYVFFTSERPGVTHALYATDGGPVVGVDVELQSLVELLDELSTRISGEVFVTNGRNTALTRDGLVDLTVPAVSGDVRVRHAVDHSNEQFPLAFGEEGEGRVAYTLDGEEHTVGIATLRLGERTDWRLVTDIADSDVPVSVSNVVRGLQVLGLAISAAAVCALAGFGLQLTRPITEFERESKLDSLTNLPNRRSIIEAGQLAAASGELRAVAMIDVDRFKAVNDTHGHAIGDEVLVRLGGVFADVGCDIGRVGGEEFVMLIGDEEELGSCVHELREAVQRSPLETSAGPVDVTISIGLARSLPGATFDQTMRLADSALLKAKLAGRNRLVVMEDPEPSQRPTVDLLS